MHVSQVPPPRAAGSPCVEKQLPLPFCTPARLNAGIDLAAPTEAVRGPETNA